MIEAAVFRTLPVNFARNESASLVFFKGGAGSSNACIEEYDVIEAAEVRRSFTLVES
jgi:hypothetical protein